MIVLLDGEHHPSVVRDAVAALDPEGQEALVQLLGSLQRGLYERRSDG